MKERASKLRISVVKILDYRKCKLKIYQKGMYLPLLGEKPIDMRMKSGLYSIGRCLELFR